MFAWPEADILGVAGLHLHGEKISMRIFPALLDLLIAADDMVSHQEESSP